MPRATDAAGQPADRDVEIASLLRLGDPEGLRRMLVDHGGRVAALLRTEFRNVLDLHEIEDALSQATVRVWRAGGRYDPQRGSLGAWLYVIARNCARHAIEAKQRHAGLTLIDDLDSLAAADHSPAAEAERGERRVVTEDQFKHDVRLCIDALPPLQRAVLRADFAVGGKAPTEALAEQLSTSPNSIYVSRNSGRKALRRAMQRLGHLFGCSGDGPMAGSA